jgi:hypothetical protein
MPLLAAVLAVMLLPQPSHAWGAKGHRTIAFIAESRLSPAAKQNIAAILGPGATLDRLAPCADFIRKDEGATCSGIAFAAEPESEPWHFVDVPIGDDPAGADSLGTYCKNGCVMNAITAQIETLKNDASSKADKRKALMFLVHFVGDEHQPLHCANDNDRGGNQKPVQWTAPVDNPKPEAEKAPLNLHSLWDHIVEPSDSLDAWVLAGRLKADLKDKDVTGWTQGDFVHEAAMESYQLAKSTIYPAYDRNAGPGGPEIDSAYQANMQPIAFDRLEMAGVRLAALLEQIFGQPVAAAKSPAAHK